MHVAINAYFWNRPETGSGQYTRQLVTHMRELVSDLQLTLVFPQKTASDIPVDVPAGVTVHPVPLRPGHLGKVLFEQRTFPRACRTLGASLAHIPYWGAPLVSPVPLVVTVHDLTTLLIREYRKKWTARLYNGLVSASARGAGHIITDSLASKQDIVEHLGIDPQQITPIYLAADKSYTDQEDLLMDMAIVRKYELPEEYILYLGGYAIHKNVTTLLHAYTYVNTALGEDFPLVLAGKPPAGPSDSFPDYQGYIDRLNMSDDVRWLGFIDEADKPTLYRRASCFVFPSRYEGFGLPPLEAMACGTPVVTTNASSLPEVVGDAAFTVEPDDARGLGGAIIAATIQEELAADLVAKGKQQAANFTWEATAAETVRVYAQMAKPN